MKRLILLALLFALAGPASAETRIFIPGGLYIDALPPGTFVALVPDSHLVTNAGRMELPPGGILHHRITEARGELSIAGQVAHGDGQITLYSGGAWNTSISGYAYGVSVAAFWPDGRLEVSTPEKRYGSQGIRYITDRVYTGDETYASAALGLHEFTTQGDISVGQGSATGGVVLVRGRQRKRLGNGFCYFVRFNRAGDRLAIAWWEAVGGRANAHAVWLDVAEIDALPDDVIAPVPVPVPPPTPEPTPTPEPRGPPVQEPDSLLDDAIAEFERFTPGAEAVGTREERGAALNRIAWKHRAKGWGLSRKSGGHNCPSVAGLIACDILQFDPTFGANKGETPIYDVFADFAPIWGRAGPHGNPAGRPWVAPGDPGLPTPGTPLPTPGTDPQIAALERKLAEAEIRLASALRDFANSRAQVSALEAERDDLKRQLEEARGERDAAIAERDAAIAKAVDEALANAQCTASIFGIKIRCRVLRDR